MNDPIVNQYQRMVARATARYVLATVPGRPEELRHPTNERGVSFAYAGGEIRVRPMLGRVWQDALVRDYRIGDGWAELLDRQLDPFFHHVQIQSLVFNHPNTGEPLTDVNVGLGDRPTPALIAERIRRV